jgi:lipopolysaccharide/colanic/teichoic acid biosynthesis glycosyltransferase
MAAAACPGGRSYQVCKRLLDLLGATLGAVVLSPLFALVAAAIRLESAGPAIYRQVRVGAHGKLFTIYKFRTMKIDTPVLSTEEMQKQGYDPYTRLGRLLRRISLDELPQLWNVFKGEMSFIGPRPALPSQADVLALREEAGVTPALPGITGLAQVRGRDNLDNPTKVACDAEYCRHLSFLEDLKIFCLTFSALFSARGNK